MKFEEHSKYAQEKFADTLLARCNSLIGGIVSLVLVVPLGVVLGWLFSGKNVLDLLPNLQRVQIGWTFLAFVVLFAFILLLVGASESHALKIYDRLHPDDHADRRA